MPSLTRVMTYCIDYMSHIIITSDILWLQATYHVVMNELHIMSTSYIFRRKDMQQNTLRISTLHHNHSKLRGHMNQFQAYRQI